MANSNVVSLSSREERKDLLTELLCSGAQRLVQEAVELELQELLRFYEDRKTAGGKAGVIRNGYLPEREIETGIGAVKVQIPKVRSRTGEPVVFRSEVVPPYVRKSASLEATLSWLYLKGISSGEMKPALEVLLGAKAAGFSASTVCRLKQSWEAEYKEWRQRPLDKDQWVYVWADGIYSGLRGEDARLCVLVIIAVNERGEKHFLAIEDGFRESTQSWSEILLNLKARGLSAPKLAVGDGALGFWAALEAVFPDTSHQRCWVHKTANVLNQLPKSLHPNAKKSLHEIWQAPERKEAEQAFDRFIKVYEAKYPKATVCLQKDREELLSFYDYPAQHWQSIRTTNPIESTFATIRHRTKRSKGCLSRNGMLHMMFKLAGCAEKSWRKLRGFEFLAPVIKGVKFKDGVTLTTVDQMAA